MVRPASSSSLPFISHSSFFSPIPSSPLEPFRCHTRLELAPLPARRRSLPAWPPAADAASPTLGPAPTRACAFPPLGPARPRSWPCPRLWCLGCPLQRRARPARPPSTGRLGSARCLLVSPTSAGPAWPPRILLPSPTTTISVFVEFDLISGG